MINGLSEYKMSKIKVTEPIRHLLVKKKSINRRLTLLETGYVVGSYSNEEYLKLDKLLSKELEGIEKCLDILKPKDLTVIFSKSIEEQKSFLKHFWNV